MGVKELTQSPINHSMFHLSLTAHQASKDTADMISESPPEEPSSLLLSLYSLQTTGRRLGRAPLKRNPNYASAKPLSLFSTNPAFMCVECYWLLGFGVYWSTALYSFSLLCGSGEQLLDFQYPILRCKSLDSLTFSVLPLKNGWFLLTWRRTLTYGVHLKHFPVFPWRLLQSIHLWMMTLPGYLGMSAEELSVQVFGP